MLCKLAHCYLTIINKYYKVAYGELYRLFSSSVHYL